MKKGKKMNAEQRAMHSVQIKQGWEDQKKRFAEVDERYSEGLRCSSTEEQLLSDWRHGFLKDDFRKLLKVAVLLLFPLMGFGQVTLNFEGDVTDGCVPLTVLFSYDSNIQPDSVLWVFGNGTTSVNGIGVFPRVGMYAVSLKIYKNGNVFSIRRPHYIRVRCCVCENQNIKRP